MSSGDGLVFYGLPTLYCHLVGNRCWLEEGKRNQRGLYFIIKSLLSFLFGIPRINITTLKFCSKLDKYTRI